MDDIPYMEGELYAGLVLSEDQLEEAISKVKEQNQPVILTYPLNEGNFSRYFDSIFSSTTYLL